MSDPLIGPADGPTGRRARLLGTGKEVWEVIAVVRDFGGDAVKATAHAAYLANSAQHRREPGAWRGQVSIAADFDDLPLDWPHE